jgi:hypothetical protein
MQRKLLQRRYSKFVGGLPFDPFRTIFGKELSHYSGPVYENASDG